MNNLSIYPNPTIGLLYIQSNSTIENVEVFDMLGRRLLNLGFAQNDVEVDVTALKNGIYFIKILSNGISETRKIIKN